MMTFATAANQHHYHKVSGCSQGRKPNYQVKKNKTKFCKRKYSWNTDTLCTAVKE